MEPISQGVRMKGKLYIVQKEVQAFHAEFLLAVLDLSGAAAISEAADGLREA